MTSLHCIGMFGVIIQVMLADGTQVQSSVVLSNATPYRTFMVNHILLYVSRRFFCVEVKRLRFVQAALLGLTKLLDL